MTPPFYKTYKKTDVFIQEGVPKLHVGPTQNASPP